MNFTSKEEYGLLATIHLAAHTSAWPIQSREIAQAEHIPEQFLEQVLAALRRAGIIRSIRGASGGYELARAPKSITAGDVIRALSGPIAPIACADDDTASDKCERAEMCVVVDLWQKVRTAIVDVLDSATIQDMVDKRMKHDIESSYMMHI